MFAGLHPAEEKLDLSQPVVEGLPDVTWGDVREALAPYCTERNKFTAAEFAAGIFRERPAKGAGSMLEEIHSVLSLALDRMPAIVDVLLTEKVIKEVEGDLYGNACYSPDSNGITLSQKSAPVQRWPI